ncbi:MAG: hypothetical protein ACXVHY_02660 [Methanobacterium sp.]
MDKNHFEQLYDNYIHMMLFSRSSKLKLENNRQEIVEIKKACSEIAENKDIQYSLNSLEGLKSRLGKMQEEIKAILYQYREIDELLHQVDTMIADYTELEIEIDLYELNGIENDLLVIKDENGKLNILKSEIKVLYQVIDDKINGLMF